VSILRDDHRGGTGPAGGDSDVDFDRWYRREFSRVRACVALVTGEPQLADRAATEAFGKARRRWSTVSEAVSPTAWVHLVALDAVRSPRSRRRLARRRPAHGGSGSGLPAPEVDPHLLSLVAGLSTRARTVIALHYLGGLPRAEVAELMCLRLDQVTDLIETARHRVGTG
jgi:RNA polymerase sigma-70 factor (ECF subfamily)